MHELLKAYLEYYREVAILRRYVSQLSLNNCYNDIFRVAQEDEQNKYIQTSKKILETIVGEVQGLDPNIEREVSKGAQLLRDMTVCLNELDQQRNANLQIVLQGLLESYQVQLGKQSINSQLSILDQKRLVVLIDEIKTNAQLVERKYQQVFNKKSWYQVSFDVLQAELNQGKIIKRDLLDKRQEIFEIRGVIEKLINQKTSWGEQYQNIDYWSDVETSLMEHIEQFSLHMEMRQDFLNLRGSVKTLGFLKQLEGHDFYDYELQELFDVYNRCCRLKANLLAEFYKVDETLSDKKILNFLMDYLQKEFNVLELFHENVQPLLRCYDSVCQGANSMLMIAAQALNVALRDLKFAEQQIDKILSRLKQYMQTDRCINKYDEIVNALACKNWSLIDAEVFAYMKQYYLQSPKVSAVLAALKEREKSHPTKSLKIKFFLEVLEGAASFAVLEQAITDALKDPFLVDSTTYWGKALGLQSTTAECLSQLKDELFLFQDKCSSGGGLIDGIVKSFKSRQENYFLDKKQSSLEWQQSFLAQLQPYDTRKDVRVLIHELHLINVSMHLSEEAKKVCMVTAMHALDSRLEKGLAQANEADRKLSKVLHCCYNSKEVLADLQSSYYREDPEDRGNAVDTMRFIYDRAEYAFIFQWQRLRMTLELCQTKRNKKNLLALCDQLLANSSASTNFKRQELIHLVTEHYQGIRSSLTGSESMFGKGSRLADALEQYLTEGHAALAPKKEIAHKMSFRPTIFSCFSV